MDKLLSRLRVLVVEDELMILMMIEGMLSDMGCESVANAGTVMQALALVEGQEFDIVLLDMNLGGDDSREVAEALVMRRVPFIYSTGNSTSGTDVSRGNQPVLRKPFGEKELAAALSSLGPSLLRLQQH